jgi:hypothetical protein
MDLALEHAAAIAKVRWGFAGSIASRVRVAPIPRA